MKVNRIRHPSHAPWLVAITIALIVALLIGCFIGYEKLRDLWYEQSEVTDYNEQVSITAGKMVAADVIAVEFGLRAGVKLDTLDYENLRSRVLAKIPNLRDIRIIRQLPDRVEIKTEERVPIARVGLSRPPRNGGISSRVVDNEGVVFICARGTRLLPEIREANAPGTPPGKTLTDRARAALRFIEACREPELQEISVLDVDVTNQDYLLATFTTGSTATYSKLKLAWDGMDAPETPASHASLIRQLTHLRNALRTNLGANAKMWDATDFSKSASIYAR